MLQQEKFFSAVVTVGAVFRSEFIEPRSVYTCIQIGSVKGLMHPPVKNQLFLFTHVMQQTAGIVIKAYHEVEIIHIQAGILIQKSDILNDLIYLLIMFLKNRGRDLFPVGN